MRLLYLDFDGVLNGHEWCHIPSMPRIIERNAKCFQAFVNQVNVKCVVVSTWKRHVLNGDLNLHGFQFLMKTHGIDTRFHSVLETTSQLRDPVERGRAIEEHFEKTRLPAKDIAILDDMDLLLTPVLKARHVRPHPTFGMEPRHVTELVELFKS